MSITSFRSLICSSKFGIFQSKTSHFFSCLIAFIDSFPTVCWLCFHLSLLIFVVFSLVFAKHSFASSLASKFSMNAKIFSYSFLVSMKVVVVTLSFQEKVIEFVHAKFDL